MGELKLDAVGAEVKKLIAPYLEKLLAIHKENIISINLYGSATGRDFSLKTSDINLLVIFKELTFEDLRKSLNLVSRGIKKKISAPLLLTLEHIKTSQDVFPIEFLEMKENYLCLYGEDLLKQMDIKRDYIRLFAEEQIKGKIIRLRQAYLEIGLRKKGIEALMKESMYSLIPVFRNLLRLKDIAPPIDKESILTKVSKEFDLEEGVLIAILKDKRDDESIAGCDIEVYFKKYLNQIQRLAVIVDKL
ncbi:MAG: hypothetical protein KKE55_02495 [Candidatus Omnitrophica bacterium]|nr:hypothetical protein [Candidatus Omnitrophota bacterium]MBU2436549.1 hypothetical protein [Candidatus Omnitrophota bacterium]